MSVIQVVVYLFALNHFSEFSIHIICQPPINITPAKIRIMSNLLMLLHLCFKDTIHFDPYYVSQEFTIVYIYILIFLILQLISDHIKKYFDCFKRV